MRAMDLEKVLAASFTLAARHFTQLFPLFFAATVINGMLLGWALERSPQLLTGAGEIDPLTLVAMILPGVFTFTFNIAVTWQTLANGAPDIASALAQALRRFLPMFAVYVLYCAAVVLGMILFIVPGLVLAVTLGFAWYCVVIDNAPPFRALRESFRLCWGNAWLVFAGSLLLVLVYGVMVMVVTWALPGDLKEIIELGSKGFAYGDWRKWVLDGVGAAFAMLFVITWLHMFVALKQLGSTDDGERKETAVVEA